MSRDRGGGYGEAAAQALPQAIPVADRWHLMQNASAAVLDAMRLSMRAVRGVPSDVFRIRQSSSERYLPVLLAEWEAGCRNGAELWRKLGNQGFKGCSRVVAEWTARRRADMMQVQRLQKAPPARILARLMTTARDHLPRVDTITVAPLRQACPAWLTPNARWSSLR